MFELIECGLQNNELIICSNCGMFLGHCLRTDSPEDIAERHQHSTVSGRTVVYTHAF